MSEEKPNFKVRDRRLFNPDGSPREIEREETKDEGVSDLSAATTQPAASAPVTQREARAQERTAPIVGGADATEPARRGDAEQQQQAGTEADPTPFANLVMFIASPAAAAMGMTEHPGMPPGEVDLPLARHCIDLLATIREKTRGNLGAQEEQILDSILAELRMQYVSLTSARPQAPPRGFTGGDITGGR
ncbi:MAG: DUF1844 domain-containing protein [Pyrinomonadaceae bacterium]